MFAPQIILLVRTAGAVTLGGRKRRDTEACVAVATPSYGTSGSMRAHACVLCMRVVVRVLRARALGN